VSLEQKIGGDDAEASRRWRVGVLLSAARSATALVVFCVVEFAIGNHVTIRTDLGSIGQIAWLLSA
jgi:hypothetical protein